uniref:Uncharacterized protein n=1 Tax=Megaselia scalaris TaxID=36166 RepID=T1GGQ8_MEGSC
WLTSTNSKLNNQLKYYENEKAKIQKAKKASNGRKRSIVKSGGSLNDIKEEQDTLVSNLSFFQKQVEQTKKQIKQHRNLIQNFNTKFKKDLLTDPVSNTPDVGNIVNVQVQQQNPNILNKNVAQ